MGNPDGAVRLTDREIVTAVCDGCMAGACKQYLQSGILAAAVRADPTGVRIIYPQGYEAELAKLLYRAADEMVSRITATESKAKH